MELGISPIVTSSMIIQFFVGARIISMNHQVPEDKELLDIAEKCKILLNCSVWNTYDIWRGSCICDVRNVWRCRIFQCLSSNHSTLHGWFNRYLS